MTKQDTIILDHVSKYIFLVNNNLDYPPNKILLEKDIRQGKLTSIISINVELWNDGNIVLGNTENINRAKILLDQYKYMMLSLKDLEGRKFAIQEFVVKGDFENILNADIKGIEIFNGQIGEHNDRK